MLRVSKLVIVPYSFLNHFNFYLTSLEAICGIFILLLEPNQSQHANLTYQSLKESDMTERLNWTELNFTETFTQLPDYTRTLEQIANI